MINLAIVIKIHFFTSNCDEGWDQIHEYLYLSCV